MMGWLKNELRQGRLLITYSLIRFSGYGIDFLIPILLATQFTPDVFGIYSLGMMVAYFFVSALVLSTDKPMIILGTEELKENDRVSATLTARMILLAAAFLSFLIILIAIRKQIAGFSGLSVFQVYFLLFVFSGKALESLGGSLLVTLNRMLAQSLFHFLTALFSILYLVVLFLFFHFSIETVLSMFLVAPALTLTAFWPQIRKHSVFPLAYESKALYKMVDFTKWMMFGGTAVYLLNWGDNLILRRFATIDEIGVYNLGYQFFKGTIFTAAIIRVYFLPFIAQHIQDPEKIRHYLVVKRLKLLILGSLCLSGLYFITPAAVRILFHSRYTQAAAVFQILLAGSFFNFYAMFYDPIFDALKRYRFIQTATIACVAFNLVLDYILVIRIGYTGAAIATALTYFLFAVIKEVYFRTRCIESIAVSSKI